MTILLRYLASIFIVSQILSGISGTPFEKCEDTLLDHAKAEVGNLKIEHSSDQMNQPFDTDFAFHLDPHDDTTHANPKIGKVRPIILDPIIADYGCPVETQGRNIIILLKLIACIEAPNVVKHHHNPAFTHKHHHHLGIDSVIPKPEC